MRFLHKLEELFLLFLFAISISALTAQLFSRYLLTYQFPWTEELARFSFTWLVFFGAAYAMRGGDLIAVTILPDKLPDRPRAFLAITMHLLGATFFAVLVWVGFKLVITVHALPTIAMGISSGFEYAAVPAASVLLCLRSLHKAARILKHGQPRDGAATLM